MVHSRKNTGTKNMSLVHMFFGSYKISVKSHSNKSIVTYPRMKGPMFFS
jgi:hypothetical protein